MLALAPNTLNAFPITLLATYLLLPYPVAVAHVGEERTSEGMRENGEIPRTAAIEEPKIGRAGSGLGVVERESERRYRNARRFGQKLERGRAKLIIHAKRIMCVVSEMR
jgi:hypothetical protein